MFYVSFDTVFEAGPVVKRKIEDLFHLVRTSVRRVILVPWRQEDSKIHLQLNAPHRSHGGVNAESNPARNGKIEGRVEDSDSFT